MERLRVSLQFRSDNRSFATEEKMKDILKKTSDFQHSNIVVDEPLHSGENTLYLSIYIYTDDIDDPARTRKALHELVDFLLDP